MSGYRIDKMMSLVIFILSFITLVSSIRNSIFQQSFAEEYDKNSRFNTDLSTTPANTYPLIIKPLNYGPAVVAPPTFLFQSPFHSTFQVPGAIPLFSQQRPTYPYDPYLSQENKKNQFINYEEDERPWKIQAPRPSFQAIRNTQIRNILNKDVGLQKTEITSESRPNHLFNPMNTELQQIANVPFFNPEIRNPTLINAAPGGIAQSTQPLFTFLPQKLIRIIHSPSEIGHSYWTEDSILTNSVPGSLKSVHIASPFVLQNLIKFSESPTKDINSDLSNLSHLKNSAPGGITKSMQPSFSMVPKRFIRFMHTPTEIGNSDLADNSHLVNSAPGGIAKSSQPSFSYYFQNSKMSPNLRNYLPHFPGYESY